MRVLSETYPTARKTYECNSCLFIFEGFGNNLKEFFNYYKLTLTEKKQVLTAKNNKYQIRAGEKYIRQTLIDESSKDFFCVKSIPEVHNICCKYNLYQEN